MQRGTSESSVIGMLYLCRRGGCIDVMKYGEFGPLSTVEVIWFTEWLIAMSWSTKREKFDLKHSSAIDFTVAQGGNFSVPARP